MSELLCLNFDVSHIPRDPWSIYIFVIIPFGCKKKKTWKIIIGNRFRNSGGETWRDELLTLAANSKFTLFRRIYSKIESGCFAFVFFENEFINTYIFYREKKNGRVIGMRRNTTTGRSDHITVVNFTVSFVLNIRNENN